MSAGENNTLKSPNFVFLDVHEPQLVRLGTLAEQYFAPDPVTCLMKLRQFGELLAQLVATKERRSLPHSMTQKQHDINPTPTVFNLLCPTSVAKTVEEQTMNLFTPCYC